MPEFKLPDLGEGVTEAEIDRWLVKEGQEISEDELIVEVITDKATAEIPSPFAGVVRRIHVGEGEIVPVGTVLISIGDEVSHAPPPPPPATEPVADEAEPASPATGNGAAERSMAGVKALPPVRKLARDLGIDITQVPGSGPDGRIERADVEAYGSGRRAEPGEALTAIEGPGHRVPFRGVRRMIAEHMLKAHLSIPPVTHVEECDVTELDAARKLANERRPDLPKLTYLPFVVRAVTTALRDHPEMNSSLDEATNEIVLHDRFDIGIAADAPHGLVVPVVREADRKSLRELAAEIERLAVGARAGSLTVDELRGSTFTVTSPGPFGGLMATPIINYPEAAILGVHRATERPVVRNGQIVVRLIMNLSITFDHRLVDGVTAAGFCMDVVKLLEHPAVLALGD